MLRRSFISSGTAAAAGFLGLQKYLRAAPTGRLAHPYGPLVADPEGILDLPKEFRYQIISKAGDLMSDGFKVPGKADGMACFEGRAGTVVLVRNHELGVAEQDKSPFSEAKYPEELDATLSYDPGKGIEPPHIGGTTNVVYDPVRGIVLREFLSLTGTDRNCAGGAMPWGSWITCEESVEMTSERGREHGYCFEVKASDDGKLQKAVPLKKLGRFRHEAVALDPETGILYLTEDMGDGLLYRFIPEKPQDLSEGQLQALMIKGRPSMDMRNYPHTKEVIPEGQVIEAVWINVEDVEAPDNDLRHRGYRAGAARFARGEGIQYSEGSFYICCTDGGASRQGQVYKLTPSGKADQPDQIELFLEPKEEDLLTNGDNLCAAPWGDLVICEDLISEHQSKVPHIRGINRDGQVYTIARNALGTSEFAGSCFSPDGRVLFVNMQLAGLTFAITGPWQGQEA